MVFERLKFKSINLPFQNFSFSKILREVKYMVYLHVLSEISALRQGCHHHLSLDCNT